MMNNFMEMLGQLKANPAKFLLQRGFNFRADLPSDPSEIVKYLLNTGQITQQQFNAAYQQMSQFRK